MVAAAAARPPAWTSIRPRERGTTLAGTIVLLVRVVEQQLAGEAVTRLLGSIAARAGFGPDLWPSSVAAPVRGVLDALETTAGTVDGWTSGAAQLLLLLLLPVGGPFWAGVVPVATTLRAARSGARWARDRVRVSRNAGRRPALHHGAVRTTILIVDDNPTFLDQARQLLARHDFDVVGTARSSAEAVSSVALRRPDVALVDVHLGPESGFDLARHLARDDQGPPVTTVLMSTHSEEDLADLVAASPAAGFVAKDRLSGPALRAVLAGRG